MLSRGVSKPHLKTTCQNRRKAPGGFRLLRVDGLPLILQLLVTLVVTLSVTLLASKVSAKCRQTMNLTLCACFRAPPLFARDTLRTFTRMQGLFACDTLRTL